MPYRLRSALAALVFTTAIAAAPAGAEPAPQTVLESFYAVLLGVMKESKSLGFAGRYDRLKPAITAAYNLPLMSRLSVGPQWPSLSAQQQADFTAAFADFTVATYANRFDDYSGETFEVLPDTTTSSGGVIVQTRLVKSNGETVSLNYLMRQGEGSWQIIDVFLSGTISELAARRSEFTSILRRDGAEGLLRMLDKRVTELKAS